MGKRLYSIYCRILLIASVLPFVVVALVVRLVSKTSYQTSWKLARTYARFVFRRFRIKLVPLGQAAAPSCSGVIFIANRTNPLEHLIWLSVLDQPFHFFVSPFLFRAPLFRSVARVMEMVPASEGWLDRSKAILAKGENILFYPEERPAKKGSAPLFEMGVVRLWQATKCPVVLLTHGSTDRVMNPRPFALQKGEILYQISEVESFPENSEGDPALTLPRLKLRLERRMEEELRKL